MKNQQRTSFLPLLILLSAALLILAGCSGSGSVTPGGTNPDDDNNNNPPPSDTYNLTIEAAEQAIEGGDSTRISLALRDRNGALLQGEWIDLSLRNISNPSEQIGYLTDSHVRTDTTVSGGVVPGVIFVSRALGEAAIRADFTVSGGTLLDSAEVTVFVVQSTHTISLHLAEDTLLVNQPTTLSCDLFIGTQENSIPSHGKQVYFSAVNAENTAQPFGSIQPSDVAVTDTTEADGLAGDYSFQSSQPGRGLVAVVYRNNLGQIAATDTSLVVVVTQ